jgi:hypothetical protein
MRGAEDRGCPMGKANICSILSRSGVAAMAGMCRLLLTIRHMKPAVAWKDSDVIFTRLPLIVKRDLQLTPTPE